ncbi:MAG TPA: DUF3280 domain-containing protein [Hyphomicrobiales bacterium]|jgi:hypothetical protein
MTILNLKSLGSAFLAACACALLANAAEAPSSEKSAGAGSAPIKLAFFDVELADFSAGGPLAGQSPEETARINLTSERLRELLRATGRYELVDISAGHPAISAVNAEPLRLHYLRDCNGCEVDIGKALGADQTFLAFFKKVSRMEGGLEFHIRDVKTGAFVKRVQTDWRGSTDESWTRAVTWLFKHRILDE